MLQLAIALCLFLNLGLAEAKPLDGARWAKVEQEIGEQKYQAALEGTLTIVQEARKSADDRLLTQALIRATQLQIGLHGYETAVRVLQAEAWPKGEEHRVLLHLYLAQALMHYQNIYSWEIGQRERTAKTGDLKSWTTTEIGHEINRQFAEALNKKVALEKEIPNFFSTYLAKNNFPAGVRPHLGGAIYYLLIDHLANQQFWTAEEISGVYRQKPANLLNPAFKPDLQAADNNHHPLEKIASLLHQLAKRHEQAGRNDAALEARYILFGKLFAAYSETNDKLEVRLALEKLQANAKKSTWWPRGQAHLAEFIQSEGSSADRWIRARRAALAGKEAAPGSVAAKFCEQILHEIERKYFQISSMAVDNPAKPSVLVNYKNINKIYLRAYPDDFEERLKEKGGNYRSLDGNKLLELVRARNQPVAAWEQKLLETSDFASHRGFVTLPKLPPGGYHIVASLSPSFAEKENLLQAVGINISDLVLLQGHDNKGAVEIRALKGESGAPVANAKISLYRFNWQSVPEEHVTVNTDKSGFARLTLPLALPSLNRSNWNYFVVGRSGEQKTLFQQNVWFGNPATEVEQKRALLFTDRSIYRPEQKILFKVMGYKGKASSGEFASAGAGQKINLQLLDPNNQVVQSLNVSLNSFGTASGEFSIPKGRPLGQWQIRSNEFSGASTVRVEEYKRPTFAATLREAANPYRLNQNAAVVGDARYYFGSPVTEGSVSWRVTRVEVRPWWIDFFGWWGPPQRSSETIASGTAKVQADGTFKFEFLPKGDERKKTSGISYNFNVEADITDAGGETRAASRNFRLGFVAVETSFANDTNFFSVGEKSELNAKLTDLDGRGRKGTGSFRWVRLKEPDSAPLPSDLPRWTEILDERFSTSDDKKRARWETDFRWESITKDWPEAEEISKGSVNHDEQGEGKITFAAKAPGVYRLHYETKDAFGATFNSKKDYLVVSDRQSLALPLVVLVEKNAYKVGETARVLLHSGLKNQSIQLDVFRSGEKFETRVLNSGTQSLLSFPIRAIDRGGFSLQVSALRDHQLLRQEININVPWRDRELNLEYASFRDQLRPGTKETFTVRAVDPQKRPLDPKAVEILAYMYDRSLDLFTPHSYPTVLSLYPLRFGVPAIIASLNSNGGQTIFNSLPESPNLPQLRPDYLEQFENYGVGGPGSRRRFGGYARGGMESELADSMSMRAAPMSALSQNASLAKESARESTKAEAPAATTNAASNKTTASADTLANPPRSNFSETAFFLPHLQLNKQGIASIEFTVPDSVTSWKVLSHALTQDLRGGSVERETKSLKELLVRPYLPRFLREGDQAVIKVVVNNAGRAPLSGMLELAIEDLESGKSAIADFSLSTAKQAFTIAANGSTALSFTIKAPAQLRQYAVTATAKAQNFSDGERRPLPILPSRMHLAQSRFVTLKNKSQKTLSFKDLERNDDKSRINDKLVVTVDGQLIYGVLQALPYLINFPYECTEQTLNRFLSTGIVTSIFSQYPAIQKMAHEFSSRKTPLEDFASADANRRMSLEETPWLMQAKGGKSEELEFANVLDSRVAKREREAALEKLRKNQLANGAFPWFAGGPPDEYMTLYVLIGFSRALEFKVDVPKEMTVQAWSFIRSWLDQKLAKWQSDDCCHEMVTLVNFALSSYPDESWTGGVFDAAYQKNLLDFSFKHWKKHSPLLKGYLALTLKRRQREADANLVWASVMDSAKLTEEQGTFWAREDRSWLWYNDHVESQAFALRVLAELGREPAKQEGLVQWLFLNKKLNHWKSTRATAEAIYSLLHYLKSNQQLGTPEEIQVNIAGENTKFNFNPEKYTGKKNQIVVPGKSIGPQHAKIEINKPTTGFAFASATWHFSTEELPKQGSGDFFSVERKYFLRSQKQGQWQLSAIADGSKIRVGDQVEVHISLRTKHEAEYVHLRDPRGAGFEPENPVSGYKWDLGLAWYEEIRDSGANFFFNRLPVGEYNFKYRVRANMSGTFRVGPAEVQSMYAPEFNAYSAGNLLTVEQGP